MSAGHDPCLKYGPPCPVCAPDDPSCWLNVPEACDCDLIAQAIEARADDLDWDDAIRPALSGELAEILDYARGELHEAAQCGRTRHHPDDKRYG